MSIISFTKMEQQIIFYLVRHGEAENNVRHILNSAPVKKEYSLTEKGRERVAKAAALLADAGADALYSSPILRAKETAEMIAEATGLPIVFDDRLWEVGMGKFNGQKQQELLKEYPEPQMRLTPNDGDGMESILHVRSRLEEFLDELKAKHAGKKVILVSHGDPLEQLHGILTMEGARHGRRRLVPREGLVYGNSFSLSSVRPLSAKTPFQWAFCMILCLCHGNTRRKCAMQGIRFTVTLSAILALVALSSGPIVFLEEVAPKKEPPPTTCEIVTGRKDQCQKAEVAVLVLWQTWQRIQRPAERRR
jgi:broad specificity phosphatase PhoE